MNKPVTLQRFLLNIFLVILAVTLGTYLGELLGGTTTWSLIDGALFTVLLIWIFFKLVTILFYRSHLPSEREQNSSSHPSCKYSQPCLPTDTLQTEQRDDAPQPPH